MFMLMSVGHLFVCQYICVTVRCPYICCVPGVVGPLLLWGIYYYSFLRYFYLQLLEIYSECFVLYCISHYISSLSNHYYSTCDGCVLHGITHPYDCYNGSQLCALCSIRSAWCGSATTGDPEGHNEMFCWPCHCATAATSVPGAISGICQLCHGFSSELSFPPIH